MDIYNKYMYIIANKSKCVIIYIFKYKSILNILQNQVMLMFYGRVD